MPCCLPIHSSNCCCHFSPHCLQIDYHVISFATPVSQCFLHADPILGWAIWTSCCPHRIRCWPSAQKRLGASTTPIRTCQTMRQRQPTLDWRSKQFHPVPTSSDSKSENNANNLWTLFLQISHQAKHLFNLFFSLWLSVRFCWCILGLALACPMCPVHFSGFESLPNLPMHCIHFCSLTCRSWSNWQRSGVQPSSQHSGWNCMEALLEETAINPRVLPSQAVHSLFCEGKSEYESNLTQSNQNLI